MVRSPTLLGVPRPSPSDAPAPTRRNTPIGRYSEVRRRVTDRLLDELIANNGELSSGPINAAGVLRLALDLKDARK